MSFLDYKYLIRSETAFAIFNTIKDLPIIDPHNHADVAELAKNAKYPDPWQVMAATDHYVWEVLRKRGVDEKYITGDADPKEKWMSLANVFPEIAGNPVYEWIHLDLMRSLEIDTLLGPDTGEEIWEEAKAVLAVKSKRPMALLEGMNVEVMCSTDDPVDDLKNHTKVNKAAGRTLVRPTWRPDKAMNIFQAQWPAYIKSLSKRYNMKIETIDALVDALQQSHDFFAENGCIASDHGLTRPFSGRADKAEAEALMKKRLAGDEVSFDEGEPFMSYLLGEMAEMNAAKDWVTQLHIGAVRDVRDVLFNNLGPDTGGDVSNYAIPVLEPLCGFLNRFDDRLKVILYCLDPVHQATLATISRAFGAKVRLGSAWWLCDTPIGMRRQLEYIGSVDLLSNFAGMVSDSRKILSYGSRFEMFRRVLADTIGTMVNDCQMPYDIGERLAKRMAYDGPKEFFAV